MSVPLSSRHSDGLLMGVGFGFGALISVLPRLAFGPPDYHFLSDTYMRLLRLREELAAGHALDVIARDSSGHGTVLHWSHLLDSLLLLLATPLGWLMPRDAALAGAAVMVGPLSMGALGALLVWALLPLPGRRFLWVAMVATCLSPAVLGYGQAGVAHHHILLVAVSVALAGWTMRLARGISGPAGGLALAAWSALGMWLSPEIFLAVFLAFGGLGWSWLRAPDTAGLREGTMAAGLALPVLMLAAVLVDPPPGGPFALAFDHLSVVWLSFALVCGAIALAMARLGRGWTLAVAIVGGGLWVAAFPAVLGGTDALFTPGPARILFDKIAEMQPVDFPWGALGWLGPNLLAVLLLLVLAWHRRDSGWAYAALCGSIVLALAAHHLRFTAYATTIGAAALPAWLDLLTRLLATRPRRAAFGQISVGFVGCLFPWLVFMLAGSGAGPARPAKLCQIDAAVPMLEAAAGQIVLTQPGYVPELLYRTRILTVGSLYIRAQGALVRLHAAWASQDWEQPGAALGATGARYLLVCRHLTPGEADDTSLLARLAHGERPDWLRQVATEPSGFTLFERTR